MTKKLQNLNLKQETVERNLKIRKGHTNKEHTTLHRKVTAGIGTDF